MANSVVFRVVLCYDTGILQAASASIKPTVVLCQTGASDHTLLERAALRVSRAFPPSGIIYPPLSPLVLLGLFLTLIPMFISGHPAPPPAPATVRYKAGKIHARLLALSRWLTRTSTRQENRTTDWDLTESIAKLHPPHTHTAFRIGRLGNERNPAFEVKSRWSSTPRTVSSASRFASA